MNHFRSAVYGDWEDVTVLSGDADVDDGGTMAFQNPSWFPKKENKPHCFFFFFNDVTRLKVNPLSSGSSPREMWVPHAYQSVHASSDQQAVLLTEVERLDAFVDAENCLVEWRPELWSPAQLDLLGLTFVAGLSDLTQLLLGVRQRQHTTSRRGKNTKLFITRPRASIKNMPLMQWFAIIRINDHGSEWTRAILNTHTHIDMLALIGEFVKDESSRVILHSSPTRLLQLNTKFNYCSSQSERS